MKKSLNPEETAEEIANKAQALYRIGEAQKRDKRNNTRSRWLVGAAAALVGGIGVGTILVVDRGIGVAEHFFSDENQNPGGPQLSGEVPRTPGATVQPKTPTETGSMVSADFAQRQVKKAMGAAGVPELPVKKGVGGDFFPKNPQELENYLATARRDYELQNSGVPQGLGAAAFNCSTFVTLGAAQKVPEGVMRAMVDSLNSHNWIESAATCNAGVMAARGENLRVPPLVLEKVG